MAGSRSKSVQPEPTTEPAIAVSEESQAAAAAAMADGVLQFLELFEQRFGAAADDHWRQVRRTALGRFVELGFPTLREEAWRFTNVARVARTAWEPPVGGARADESALAALAYEGARQIVVVDGRLRAELSDLPPGVRVESLVAAMEADDAVVREHLTRHARYSDQPFAALNTALFEDGVVLSVERGVVVQEPLHVLFVTSTGERPVVTFPRLLVVLGRSSQASVIESYATLGTGDAFTCAVGEVVLDEDAVLDYYRIVRESTATAHLAVSQFRLERAATLDGLSILYGGGLVRCDVNAYLAGEGVDCTLDGLYVGRGTQLLDTHLRVDHASPHGNSHELYKGVLDEQARAVFSGLLHVHPRAQKTDAKQTNRNLLLSDRALVNSNPQLEIYADDVRCTHGSTTGQLDADALFYLRSRGIPEAAARSVLTFAFVAELLEGIKVSSLRRSVERALAERLPGVGAIEVGDLVV